jgi:2-alkenal reductase
MNPDEKFLTRSPGWFHRAVIFGGYIKGENIYKKRRKEMVTRYSKTLIPVFLLLAALLAGCGGGFSLEPLAEPADQALTTAPVVESQVDNQVVESPAEDQPVLFQAQPPLQADGLVEALQATYEQVYQQVSPSVVNIQVSAASFQGQEGGLGSGFVWDTQGHIVTNNHVVEGASQIEVTFMNGETVDAELVGADPDADLAVIQVDGPETTLQPVTLADSSQVQVGQIAIAIGNPYGLSGTMTEGIVSGVARSLPVRSGEAFSGGSYTIPDIIQTNAAINPGNSGGVLVDIQGQVIGVTTAIRSTTNSNSGIGFVVPANIVMRVVPALISTGSYQHPRMGISGLTLTRDLAEAMNLPAGQKGVAVMVVSPNSPAANAGLQGSPTQQSGVAGGDVITAIDGQAVDSFEDLTSYLFNNTQVGQTVTLTLLRQGQEQTVELTLGVLPRSTDQ